MYLLARLNVALSELRPFPPQDNIFRLASHFENGRGKSPYDPKMLSASILIGEFDPLPCRVQESTLRPSAPNSAFSLPTDGELYSGTSADFMGRDFAIFRTLGDHHPIRTEQHDSRWLNGNRYKHVENVFYLVIIHRTSTSPH